ncbi:MAG TPA: hypothetical protein VFG76_10785 [Candidatus Polarisedimenticolia bacterium]|nr:hypothetical protein [Candidatus Polarisedimenticolia bacterium]
MNGPGQLDADDPFGSRLDEKPPDGWDDKFWEEIRREIEARKDDPASRRLPDPPRRRRGNLSLAALAGLLAAAALLSMAARSPRGEPADLADPSLTLVQVECCEPPEVAVEWARRDGSSADYVVFRSLAPDISYVVLTPPPARQDMTVARR